MQKKIPNIDFSKLTTRQLTDMSVNIELAKRKAAAQLKTSVSRLQTTSGLVNSGRVSVYVNETPFDTDILRNGRYQQVDNSNLAATVLGTGLSNPTFVRDLPCTPISPAGLGVTVGTGAIYSSEPLEPTDWSSLPADTNANHYQYKQAVCMDPVNLTTPAPLVSGNSVIHLVEVQFQTQDVNPVSRPYFNSTNPDDPDFETASDTRQDIISIVLKQGVEGLTPTPPTPDAGYTGLYYVTVAYGQTTIISGNITKAPGAPFITESLTQKISQTTADLRYVQISQEKLTSNISATDISGSANTITVNPTNAYAAYSGYTRIYVKVAHTNTGSSTINISGHGANTIKIAMPTGLINLTGGEMVANGVYEFIYNGSNFILLNPNINAVIPDTDAISFGQVNQTIAQNFLGALTKFTFDTVNVDDFGYWDSGSNSWILAKSGWYNLSFSLQIALVGDTSGYIKLFKNGSFYSIVGLTHYFSTGNVSMVNSGSIQVFSNGSNAFSLYVDPLTAGDTICDGNNNTFGFQFLGP